MRRVRIAAGIALWVLASARLALAQDPRLAGRLDAGTLPAVQGVVDSADLVYFASLIAFGLYICLQIVAAQRWSGD